MLVFPEFNPIILTLGPLQLNWYGTMYIIGITAGYFFSKRYFKTIGLNSDEILNLISGLILGIIIGGRLGYVCFYNAPYYLSNPLEIIAIWKGGMSYHGGAIGCLVSIYIASKVYKKNIWKLLDVLGIASTFGLGFGRLGNFINGELYGRPTDMPWGMIFPHVDMIARHPSQLYEAFFEGLVLFLLLYYLLKKRQLIPGALFSAYLVLYGLIRFNIEFFREADAHLGTILGPFTMGQLLSSSMILFGITLYFNLKNKEKSSP